MIPYLAFSMVINVTSVYSSIHEVINDSDKKFFYLISNTAWVLLDLHIVTFTLYSGAATTEEVIVFGGFVEF